MLVSVITICYNSEEVIEKTIESVLNQTYSNIEYLIIDGASQDKTVEIAQRYERQFEERGMKYRIISEKDNGIYDAMNKGIRNATGKMVGIINSGDYYEPTMIETAVTAYEDDEYDLFFADINLIKDNKKVIIKRSKMDKFPTSRHWNHPTMIVRKDYYNKIGTYLGVGIHDDFDFYLRARRDKAKITIKNEILANFVTGGASNAKSVTKSIERIKDRYKCYRRNGYSIVYWFECVGIEVAKWILS